MTEYQAATATLSDPAGASSLASAALWVQQALLGSVGTAVAVIAVASIGFLMLSGRAHVRRGATVVMGCFLLFGAPAIAAALRALAYGATAPPPPAPVAAAPAPIVQYSTPPGAYDPYAGASLAPR